MWSRRPNAVSTATEAGPLQVVAIVGPTAAGKTALSLELAERLGAEIVSLDAYQVYRGMDIGTAKASPAERSRVPHHLVDIVDIDHPATVFQFQELAQQAIAEINARGQIAVCVGGSGFYVRAVLDQLDVPPTDAAVRAKFTDLLEQEGAAALHAQLAQLDPTAARLISPGNVRRVVRALEVIELTGRPYHAELPQPQARYRECRIGLRVPREVLAERIEQRVRGMFAAGWLQEVAMLIERGLLQTSTAKQAIGYREAARVLSGEIDLELAIQQISALTLKYSKHQMQWFGRDQRIHWFDFDEPALADKALALLA